MILTKKSIYIISILLFFALFAYSQDEILKITDLNKKNHLTFSFAETKYSEDFYFSDTCCVALELYKWQAIPPLQNQEDGMFVFETEFFIDKSLENQDIALAVGAMDFPCRIFLNGKFLTSFGEIKGQYVSKIQFSSLVQLPPEYLKLAENNELTIQIYPKGELKPALFKYYIASKKIVDKWSFWRNFVRINLVQASIIFTLILSLYFIFGFIQKRDKSDKKYLIFALFCVFFSGAYANVAFSYNSVNEFFLYKSARLSLLLAELFLLLLTINFTGYLNKKKILIGISIPIAFFELLLLFQTDVFGLEKAFNYFASSLNLPYMLTALILSLIAAIKKKHIHYKVFFAGFLVMFLTIIHDTFNYISFINPYSWMIPFGFFFLIIANFFIMSSEQTIIFHQSIERGSELQKMKDNLEELVKERTLQIEQQKEELITQSENLRESNTMLEEKHMEILQQKEEIQAIADNLNQANVEIQNSNELLERTNSELTASINYAKRIQLALFPDMKLFTDLFSEYFIFFKPRDIVSGDFYFLKKVKNKIFISVADCTGHGVPGAFMSLLGIAFLNEIISRNENLKSNEILEKLRKLVKLSLQQKGMKEEQKDGMDLAFCIYDTNNSILQYSGANNPIIIYRNNELVEFKAVKNPIGIYLKERNFEIDEIKIFKNDCLYMFTDGFTDQIGGDNGRRMKIGKFRKIISENAEKSMKLQKDEIEKFYNEWTQTNFKQIDDILILGVRF